MASLNRPQNKQIVDPQTNRLALEWDAYFSRLESIANALVGGGVASFEGRAGAVVSAAGDYTASEITNVPAGNIAAVTVQAALNELDSEKQAADATLAAFAAYNTNGLLTQTAADTFTGRAITGTANEVSVADGSGVAGNPTLSLPATIDLGGKTSLEIPNGAAPTVDADGEIAVDTTVTDFSHGIMKYFSGEELGVVAMPIAQFTAPTGDHVVTYDATNDEFKLAAAAGGSGSVVLLTSGTVSAAATLDIVLTSYTGYRGLVFMLDNFIPATDGVSLMCRFSTDGGSTYDAGAGNYRYAGLEIFSAATAVVASTSAIQIVFSGASIGNDSVGGANLTMYLRNQTSAALHPRADWQGSYYATDNNTVALIGDARRLAAQDTDAVAFFFSGGSNIASGNYAVYGLL